MGEKEFIIKPFNRFSEMNKPNYFANLALSLPKFNYLLTTANIRSWIGRTNQLYKDVDFRQFVPRIGGTIETTIDMLFKLWKRDRAKYKNNTEMRFTYSYLLGFMKMQLNQQTGCCLKTIKNHIARLVDQYDADGNRIHKGIFTQKRRDTLQMADLNTACLVLDWNPEILQWENEKLNKAKEINVELQAIEARYTPKAEETHFNLSDAHTFRNNKVASIGSMMPSSLDSLKSFFKTS